MVPHYLHRKLQFTQENILYSTCHGGGEHDEKRVVNNAQLPEQNCGAPNETLIDVINYQSSKVSALVPKKKICGAPNETLIESTL